MVTSHCHNRLIGKIIMNEYETEEQQVEALKRWWKENSSSLIIGLAVGVSSLFGWRYYIDQNHAHSVVASDMYMQVMQQASLNNIDDKTIDLSNQLINNFSDTPYAALSSLALAKAEYDAGNVDGAVIQLELAVKYASDDVIKQTASLRLIRLHIDQKKYDEALSMLFVEHNSIYDSQYEELKGDAYEASGKTAEARIAYDKAIQLQGASTSQWLKLKRQNLGSANPASDSHKANS